jgi:hypothetical protein
MIGDPRKVEITGAQQHVGMMTRATALNGHAQQTAQPRDPIQALAQAVVALWLGQLALLSQLADLAHDRRLMQADLTDTEHWVVDLVNLRRVAPGVLDAPHRAKAAVAPLTTHAKVNIMVCTAVEPRDLDDAGTRSRLNKQPDYHHHFDARRLVQDSGHPGTR